MAKKRALEAIDCASSSHDIECWANPDRSTNGQLSVNHHVRAARKFRGFEKVKKGIGDLCDEVSSSRNSNLQFCESFDPDRDFVKLVLLTKTRQRYAYAGDTGDDYDEEAISLTTGVKVDGGEVGTTMMERKEKKGLGSTDHLIGLTEDLAEDKRE
ncbi:hypothetical protein SSX86_011885 [Deinandra increscens subsp. villosa]|uniref:Uncharacterized protein n=1 Tax=Deinandra increscens subsp. villosa TaxID=3103831 RepID=A0AAP0D3I6_9ASTR